MSDHGFESELAYLNPLADKILGPRPDPAQPVIFDQLVDDIGAPQ